MQLRKPLSFGSYKENSEPHLLSSPVMEENGEGTHAMQREENVGEKESHDPGEDAVLEASKKHGKGSKGKKRKAAATVAKSTGVKATHKKRVSREPSTPAIERPARERKSIERFADSVEREKEKPKELRIEQGSGAYLRDIPNVVFKLSKRKWSDEPVQLLHKLLYNRKVKPHVVKSNILQFSGCVWGPNEEKEKSKFKEKLEKCFKESLFQLSDLLDLNMTRITKKEDVVLRLFEFLECPHKTTDKLIQEEEQRLKKKKLHKSSAKGKKKKSSGETPRKRQKREKDKEQQDEEVEEDDREEEAEEPEEEDEPVKKISIKMKEPSRDAKSTSAKKPSKRSSKKSSAPQEVEEQSEEPVEEPEEVEAELEEDHEEPKRKRAKNKRYEDNAVPKSPTPKSPTPKSPMKSVTKNVKKKSVYEPGEEDLDDDVKEVKSKPLSKVSKKEALKEGKTLAQGGSNKEKKKSSSSSSKASSKREHNPKEQPSKKGRGASQSASKEENESSSIPPDDDLRAAICELLRDADFSTVTFTDVVKQLGAKFNVDLSQNKAHVKNLIQEEISKIVDEDDGDGDGDGDNENETGVSTPERGEKVPVEATTED